LYKDQQFDCAVDKGTLDAIAVDAEEKTVKMCQAYFNEAMHVLKKNGTLMIVSLLQPHVLKMILDFFIKGENNLHIASCLFEVKIQRIVHIEGYAEKQFIKYFISIQKSPIDSANPKKVDMQDMVGLKDSPEHTEQFLNFDQAIEKIKVDQQIYMIAPTLKNLDGQRDIAMHCYDYSSGN
jgi:ubiquinone/menaquinone biosynthesis C-methylase UbiE